MDFQQARPGVRVTIGPAYDAQTRTRRPDEFTGKQGTIGQRNASDGDVFVDLDGGGGVWVSHGRLTVIP